jgi:PAS domain-containing protein
VVKHGVTEFLQTFQDVGTTFFDIERDYLIVLDGEGNIKRVNPAFEKGLKRDESSVLKQGIIRLVLMDDWAKFMHSFDPIQHETIFRMLRAEQGVVSVRLIAYRFRRVGEEQHGYLILRPLTQ